MKLFRNYRYWEEQRFKTVRECLSTEEKINRIGSERKQE